MSDKSPEQLAQEEFRRAWLTIWRWGLDHGRRYLTASLLKFILAGVIGVGIAAYSLPALAAIACGVAVAGGIIYGVYGRRLYHDERGSRRWTWIVAKRLQQDKLWLEQRLDTAVFDVLGRAPEASAGGARSSPELRQAIAVLRHQSLEAQRQQLAGATQQEQRPAPKGPNLNAVQARMKARKADIDALEAEIQSLAVPENADAAMAAEEARKHEKSVTDSVRKAEREARERVRRGYTATQAEPSLALQLQWSPTGARDVRQVTPPVTPEQIAQGQRDVGNAGDRPLQA